MSLSLPKYPSLLTQISYKLGKHQKKRISISTQELPSRNSYNLTEHEREQLPVTIRDKYIVPYLSTSDRVTKFYFRNVQRQDVSSLPSHKLHVGTNNILRRLSHHERREQKRPVPRIYYIQNPLYWLDNKISFRYLRKLWDPEFNEREFKRGANQAVSTVTHLIATDNYPDLKGLVSDAESRYLRRVFASKEFSRRIRHLAVDTDDIQVSLPRKVNLTKHFEQKFCDIDMVYVAEKWTGLSETDKLALIVMLVRFHREFTEGVVPSWIITLFRVTKLKFYPSDPPPNRN